MVLATYSGFSATLKQHIRQQHVIPSGLFSGTFIYLNNRTMSQWTPPGSVKAI